MVSAGTAKKGERVAPTGCVGCVTYSALFDRARGGEDETMGSSRYIAESCTKVYEIVNAARLPSQVRVG